ncbi:hypothetical protein AVEN_24151-1 [Araneus ventricosus]|uniref:Uncharacterized protein n=1 Tax=Araneus ventricosus TaxID=182803 RepID=A0A4Y2KF30_ARAVE|nr:hypothetical protein AVEN_24151-1 [Araneus ventricosus]
MPRFWLWMEIIRQNRQITTREIAVELVRISKGPCITYCFVHSGCPRLPGRIEDMRVGTGSTITQEFYSKATSTVLLRWVYQCQFNDYL